MIALLLFALSLVPMHGTLLSVSGDRAIVRNDAIPATLPSVTRLYRLSPRISAPAGSGIEGFIDRRTSPWTLRRALIAAPFSPGMPDPARVRAIDVGSALPSADLVDQNGNPLDLATAFAGKTVLLSFLFTRCPDRNLCPAISGKYAFLQGRLDPLKFSLVEITLDPPYDSPAMLLHYGAQFGAKSGSWYLLTGTPTTIERVLNQFGINSLRVSAANFIHNDKLFIVTPAGRVAYIVDTAGWDPDGVAAEASAVAGMSSNPIERFKLSLIASLVALCGGSQYAGIVFLELALVGIVVIAVAAGLWTVGRVLWKN
jgi:cytochrome oxidase Cu insertion factor (SCO1/SenC/PrrC family)